MLMNDILSVFRQSRDHAETMDALLLARLEKMKIKFLACMRIRTDPEDQSAITDRFERLPTRHKARLLTSTELCELLQVAVGSNDEMDEHASTLSNTGWVAMVHACIAREEAIHNFLSASPIDPSAPCDELGRIWSPLGDAYLTGGPHERELHNQPTIGGVITVDFDSPLSRRNELRSGVLCHDRVEMTSQERDAVAEKLGKALAIIDTSVPAYGLLIRNFTRRIIVRKTPFADSRPYAASSEHVPRQPGSIRISNPHLAAHSIYACAEQLLHESTHNFLAAFETAYGRFFASDEQYRPVSPWSGNPIPNSSLAHAIFIYYVCYQLFNGFANRRDLMEDGARQIEERRRRFAVGFLIDQPLDSLFVAEADAAPDLRRSIQQVQTEIRALHAFDSLEIAA
jgi:hypothetical protein